MKVVKTFKKFGIQNGVSSIAFSPDGKYLAVSPVLPCVDIVVLSVT